AQREGASGNAGHQQLPGEHRGGTVLRCRAERPGCGERHRGHRAVPASEDRRHRSARGAVVSAEAFASLDEGRTRVPKASSILADELRTTIVRGKLQPGDPFLSEAELIEKHGL